MSASGWLRESKLSSRAPSGLCDSWLWLPRVRMETIPWHIRRKTSLSHLLDPQALWGLWKHGEIQGPPEIPQEGTLHRVSSLPSTQDQGSRSFWDSTNRQPGLGLLRKVGKWAGLSHRSL